MLVCGCVQPYVSAYIAEGNICDASVYWLAPHWVIGQRLIEVYFLSCPLWKVSETEIWLKFKILLCNPWSWRPLKLVECSRNFPWRLMFLFLTLTLGWSARGRKLPFDVAATMASW